MKLIKHMKSSIKLFAIRSVNSFRALPIANRRYSRLPIGAASAGRAKTSVVPHKLAWVMALAALFSGLVPHTHAAVTKSTATTISRSESNSVGDNSSGSTETVEVNQEDQPVGTDAWLGVSTSEASETLSSQLNLRPGVGLVINYVASNSPAAKAGLQKNDVLVRLDDQSLVHPA